MSDVVLRIDADTARYIAKINRMAQKGEQAGGKVKKGFDFRRQIEDSAKAMIPMVTASGGLLVVQKQITAEYEKRVRLQNEVASRERSAMQSRGSVMMLANTAEERQRYGEFIDRFRYQSASDASTSAAVVQAMISQGIADNSNLDLLAQSATVGNDPLAIVNSIGALRGSFGFENNAANNQMIFQKLIAGGLISPQNAAAVGSATAASGTDLSAIGSNLEEALSFMATIRGPKTLDETSTRLRAFARALEKMGITDKGLAGGADEIQRMAPNDEDLKNILTDGEARAGYRLIQQARQQAADARLAIADPTGLMQRKMALAEGDPVFNRALEMGRAEQTTQMVGEYGIGDRAAQIKIRETNNNLLSALVAEARRRGFSGEIENTEPGQRFASEYDAINAFASTYYWENFQTTEGLKSGNLSQQKVLFDMLAEMRRIAANTAPAQPVRAVPE